MKKGMNLYALYSQSNCPTTKVFISQSVSYWLIFFIKAHSLEHYCLPAFIIRLSEYVAGNS